MTMTAEQYGAAINAQRVLVESGYHPSVAGQIVRRAIGRAAASGLGCGGSCKDCCCCSDGLGKMQPTRSLRRDLDPSIKPRQVIAGEQCVRLQEIPGNETVLYQQLQSYRDRGWNVMEVSPTAGGPSVQVYWACPPGRVPMEAQGQVLQSQLGATPDVLTQISAAGADPTVSAIRDIVGKWSWLIPVGGLLMSAKQKISGFVSPSSVAVGGSSRRR